MAMEANSLPAKLAPARHASTLAGVAGRLALQAGECDTNITNYRFYPTVLGLLTAAVLLGAEFLVAARPAFFPRMAWGNLIPFVMFAFLAARKSGAWVRVIPLALLPYGAWHLHVLIPAGFTRLLTMLLLALLAGVAVGFEARGAQRGISAEIRRGTHAVLLFVGAAVGYGILGFVGGKASLAIFAAGVSVPLLEIAEGRRSAIQDLIVLSLIAAETFWALLLFPFGYLTKGFLFAALVFGSNEILRALRLGESRRAIRASCALGALVAVVMAGARWG